MIKAYDLMKLAAENPKEYEGRRYKCVCTKLADGLGGLHDEIVVENGRFQFTDDGKGYSVFVSNDTGLEEIKPKPQPVPFTEALEAYSEGKTVECETKVYSKQTYKPSCEPLNDVLRSSGGGLRVKEMLEGTWYILD
jgi:hypothetical protein